MVKNRFGMYKQITLNILIAAIVLGLYCLSTQSDSVGVLGRQYAVPVYRGYSDDSIAVMCSVEWNAASLEAILDTLSDSGQIVTFLVSGEWAENNPQTLIRMYADGHEIGVLGMDPHEDGTISWVIDDVASSVASVERITGYRPTVYHPGSRELETSALAAHSLEMDAVMCTADLRCARGGSGEIMDRALENASSGSIIKVQPTAAFAEALPRLLSLYSRKGLLLASASELIGGQP